MDRSKEVTVENLVQEALDLLPQPISGMLPRDLKIADVSDSNLAYVVAVSRVLAARAIDEWLIDIQPEGAMSSLKESSSVLRYRHQHLPGGQLLPPEEIEGWILDHAAWDARAGAPTERYLVWIQPEDILRREAGGLVLKPNARIQVEESMGPRVVEYATPTAEHREQPVRTGGELDTLRRYVRELVRKFYWTPAQAVVYILTDLAPISASFAKRVIQEKERRPKAMSRKHLQLAEFTAEHLYLLGESLAVRMAAWNERYPEWAYKTVSHFSGDSVLALRRTEGEREKPPKAREEAP